ncbi:MAG TPA: sigma factor [Thermoanaerobaculia bacterium]|nr:sigma factor [Thermoanaerobaculia bacterium]
MTVERAVREERLLSSYEHSGVFLFQETYSGLVRLAVSRGVDSTSADDVAQDALATLFEQRPEVRQPEHWLARIVLRRSCDFWRERDIEQRALERMPCPAAARGEADPIRRGRLSAALRTLPRKSRILIRSRYFEGHDEASAARAAGYAPASFKKAMTRALAGLRLALRSSAPRLRT